MTACAKPRIGKKEKRSVPPVAMLVFEGFVATGVTSI